MPKRTIPFCTFQPVSKAYLESISPTGIIFSHLRMWLTTSWANERWYVTLVLTQLFSQVLNRRNKLFTGVLTFFSWDMQIFILITRWELTRTFIYLKIQEQYISFRSFLYCSNKSKCYRWFCWQCHIAHAPTCKKIIFLLTTEKHSPKIKNSLQKSKGCKFTELKSKQLAFSLKTTE